MTKDTISYKFDFFKNRKIFISISVAILLIGLVVNIVMGTKINIQFVGGAMIKYSITGVDVTADDIEKTVADGFGREATVTVNKPIAVDAKTQVTLAFSGNEGISLDDQRQVADILSKKYDGTTFEVVESSSVDPTMGAKFLQKCLVAMALTTVFLLLYIAYRFRKIGGLSAGVTSIIALLHDILITYFIFVAFRLPIDDIFIAVVLTILGYSLNDTIVVYDRIRENKRLFGPKAEISELVNLSLNQTIKRSILTSVATFLALLVVFIVAVIYQLDSVVAFALPMMGGIIAGAYSSLVIAVPTYAMWQIRKKNVKKS